MALLLQHPAEVARDHFRLSIDAGPLGESTPGQFINIRAGTGTDPLIRRPFSVFDHRDGALDIVIRVVGRGTKMLSACLQGAEIDILGPLGRGFTLTEKSRVLLVGGGVGNAPLHYLARKLLGRDNRITYLYGARSRDYIYLREQYRASCERFIMVTDDGSEGERGYVTGACARLLETESFDFIYTCGPSAMMKELMRVLAGVETPVEVSLENYFGCGVGLCSGCSVETVSGNRRACVDGPVMDGRIIKWESPA